MMPENEIENARPVPKLVPGQGADDTPTYSRESLRDMDPADVWEAYRAGHLQHLIGRGR